MVADCPIGTLGHTIQLRGVRGTGLMTNARGGKIRGELCGDVLPTVVTAESANGMLAILLKGCAEKFETVENIIFEFHWENGCKFGTIIYKSDVVSVTFTRVNFMGPYVRVDELARFLQAIRLTRIEFSSG
jgi:hypothetical protein